MNLDKLFQAQKELREHINYNGEDRFEKLVLALLVEIGECANEWRGFKFWSKNQEPKKSHHTTSGATRENAKLLVCGECGDKTFNDDPRFGLIIKQEKLICMHCKTPDMFLMREKNALLEEYVDGLHFLLEIGIEIGHENFKPRKLVSFNDEATTKQFTGVYWLASKLSLEDLLLAPIDYEILFNNYLHLGKKLGFTWEQVENAYFAKNQINHSRQENGY